MNVDFSLSDADINVIASRTAAIVLAALAAPPKPGSLLTEQRAATELNVADHCLRDARKRGEIEFFKIGKFVRYSREQLDDFKRRIVRNGGSK